MGSCMNYMDHISSRIMYDHDEMIMHDLWFQILARSHKPDLV